MKKLLVLVFAVGATVASWVGGWLLPSRSGKLAELTNRPWVDKVAKDSRDTVVRLYLGSVARQSYGAVVHSSHYRVLAELTRFNVEGDRLTLEYPQSRKKAAFVARIYGCEGKAPAGFDLCLDLQRNGKRLTLYSKKNLRGTQSEAALGLLEQQADCDDCTELSPESFFPPPPAAF